MAPSRLHVLVLSLVIFLVFENFQILHDASRTWMMIETSGRGADTNNGPLPSSTAQSAVPESVLASSSQKYPQEVQQRRRLEFLHIPKTGGTVIESIAARHGITWSICHFALPRVAPIISNNETHCPSHSLKFPWPQQPKYHQCPWWHVPSQYFDLQPANPYKDADLFVVVRNVYDRLISEYYYVATYLSENKTHEAANNVHSFNRFITQHLQGYQRDAVAGHVDKNKTGNARYFANAGHWIPQYDFVYDHDRKVVQHILRFESLADDFDELMKKYNLSHVKLPTRQFRPSHDKELGVYNMTRQNLDFIERVYEHDFREFGYPIMSERIPKEILDRNDQEIMAMAKD